MYELWRIQKWKNCRTVKYRIYRINNEYICNIKKLNLALQYLEKYHSYLNKLSKETDHIIYSDNDYILIYENNTVIYKKNININYEKNYFKILLYLLKLYLFVRFCY